MIEPEVTDLQLTIDTLKTGLRDAQRTGTELRAELDARRRELADAIVARARLEGRLREAERRLAEARHIIDLQREELASARTEREKIARTGVQLQLELKRLHRQLAQVGKSQSGAAAAAPAAGKARGAPKTSTVPLLADAGGPRVSVKTTAMPVPSAQPPASQDDQAAQDDPPTGYRAVSVHPGDTLWSIARRYRVDVARLRAVNRLPNDRILAGQALWLPRSEGSSQSDMQASNPAQP